MQLELMRPPGDSGGRFRVMGRLRGLDRPPYFDLLRGGGPPFDLSGVQPKSCGLLKHLKYFVSSRMLPEPLAGLASLEISVQCW